jgi:hypothetical protein
VILQNVLHVFFVVKIALKVLDRFTGELVEKLGVFLVVDFVEVDETADEIVFQSVLGNDAVAADKSMTLVVA